LRQCPWESNEDPDSLLTGYLVETATIPHQVIFALGEALRHQDRTARTCSDLRPWCSETGRDTLSVATELIGATRILFAALLLLSGLTIGGFDVTTRGAPRPEQ
jgi:hypothetical protein